MYLQKMERLKILTILASVLATECQSWYFATERTPEIATNSDKLFDTDKNKRYIANNTEEPHKIRKYFSSHFHAVSQDFKPSDLEQITTLYRASKEAPGDEKPKIKQHFNDEYFKNIFLSQKRKVRRHRPKANRFLEVFEVVEFDHIPCFSSTGLEGTCLHEYDCEKINGTSMGTCADGYGICCIILLPCDSRSSSPIGWFTNPGFPGPSTDRLSCTLTLDKLSDQIKQLRLDFMSFEILSPTFGSCEQDQFMVTGQNVNNVIPVLCGINSGQHMYIEISESEGPITLSFQTVTSENRLFSIKITQLTAADRLSAPTGCLQYFKDDKEYMESFNYRDTTEIGITRTPSYLNNLNYAMCIERKAGSCSVTYTNVADMQIVNFDTDGLPVIPPRQAGVEIFDCPSDWLLISAVRLCGERLNDGAVIQDFSLDAPVTDDNAGPIVVWFRSDGIYTGRGFKLHYQQNPCTT